MPWFLNTIEDTKGRYSEVFRASLLQFHGYVSRLSSELPAIADEAAAQRLQYQVRMQRDMLSEAAQKELAAALSSPSPLSLVLNHVQEHEITYFVATIKNETEEQITNWAVQLEVPPLLVNGFVQGARVPEESDPRRAVFRTTPRTAETRPLWHGATFPFKVRYQLGETNQGLRASNVRATAYVGGKLVAEQIKGVDELSAYFVPAVVARRDALTGLLMHASQVGAEVGKTTPPPSSGGSPVARLAAIPTGTTARLSYRLDGSEVVHDKHRIEVIGVDWSANAFRFKSVTGVSGAADSMPLEDVETAWVDEKGTPVLRISGFMKHTPLEPYRYVSRPSSTPRSTGVADLLAAKKVDAIERLSKAANLLTSTVMNTMGRGTNGPMRGLCPEILAFTHLTQETRDYYSTTFYDALMAFHSCAQGTYVELGGLRDEDFHRVPALHGRVETGRLRLSEAIQTELHGRGP